MLPGLRFLFAAIVLTMSILVFGLGAAALLRAAHEEVAGRPSWRVTPEAQFTQQNEATRPVLAMLRLEPPAEPRALEPAAAADAPAEPAAIAATPAERIAALRPEISPPAEAPSPEVAVQEIPAQNNTGPAIADAPAAAGETRIAATEQLPSPANDAAPAASEAAIAPVSPATDIASTKIATLGGPPVTIEPPSPAKDVGAKPERSGVKKRQQARRAAHRRKLALQAHTAQQPAAAAFNQPTITVRNR